jgi:hypothetical protein
VFVDGAVTSDVYLCLLSDEFVSFLMGCGIPVISAWFQQDGARPHTGNTVLHFFHDGLEQRVLLNR